MNQFSKKLCIVLVSAMVAFAGCTKKPKRPAPSDTVLGQGGSQSGLNAGGMEQLGDPSASGLAQREGVMENEDMIKGLLDAVYFEFNESAIRAGERPKLQAVKDYLDKNPQYRILFEGHCDWRGTGEYNMGLGDRRAAAAKKYLQTLGVPVNKIETISKGDLEAQENASEDQMAKDRRAEVIVLKK
jgi:peptidoglycan-associated lipoprotein